MICGLAMPRSARIDGPGALHHIIARGISRRRIFDDDADREAFLDRLGAVLNETDTACFAWALIPNHFHLVLRTGHVPVTTVMRRLLTGYAMNYNRRHRRSGHLFQNRYKSILCQQEPYFLELVRYLHLNPLRAKVVHVSVLMDIPIEEIWSKGKYRRIVAAGSLTCFRAVNELNVGISELARRFGISDTVISKSVLRGKALAIENNYKLEDDVKV